jgi:hypothetical protein
MSISEISLYNALKIKLGDQTASDLVEFVKSEVKSELDAKSDNLLTKTDKLDLIDRMNKAKTETIVWIVGIGVIQFVLAILSKKFL